VNRRAQRPPSGGSAATLVGIMLLLFIFYILFLPPQAREELLEDGSNGLSYEEGLLLNESPQSLSFTDKSVFDHNIPNLFLSAQTNAIVIAQENPFAIYKGWFGEKRKSIRFSIDELEQTENIILSFQAPVRHGTLVIELNGQTIYEAQVNLQNPPPVRLPRQMLSESNQLEMSVTGSWWSTREYELTDIKIVGEVTETATQIAETSFRVSNVEYDNLEKSFLDFYPVCNQRDVGVLTIELNGRIVHSSAPSCDSLNRQDLFQEDLKRGKNTLTLRITQGSYRIEQIRVRNILEPVETYIDYFYVPSSVYNDILDDERDAMLFIEFVDDRKAKRAELNINGVRDVIDQTDREYEKNLRRVIREGNNVLEIKPLTDLDILKLEVRAG